MQIFRLPVQRMDWCHIPLSSLLESAVQCSSTGICSYIDKALGAHSLFFKGSIIYVYHLQLDCAES